MEKILEEPLPEDRLKFLLSLAKDYALLHGFLIRKPEAPNSSEEVNYGPFTLFPTPIPRKLYEQGIRVQKDYNLLYHKVAMDHDFLSACLSKTIRADDFTRRLWNIYETVYTEGIKQPISLGIHRSDYMMDYSPEDHSIELKQIEFNTIASSFAGLDSQINKLHRFLLKLLLGSQGPEKIPPNNALPGIAEGMVEAWRKYGNDNAVILFVMEENERNVFDQRWIEFSVYESHYIPVIRKTFKELRENSCLDDNDNLIVDGDEVALVYFRCGYSPLQYKDDGDYELRLLIERSRAIKCPSIHYHLAGTKKVQQELCRPGAVEMFIKDPDAVKRIRATFAAQYSLEKSDNGDEAIAIAMHNPSKYVVKPQREGGGNNIYGDDIRPFLESITNTEERNAYIIMQRIFPKPCWNYVVKANHPVIRQELINELGFYGVFLGDSTNHYLNKNAGQLLRTKSKDADEGGVIVGVSGLDSMYLLES